MPRGKSPAQRLSRACELTGDAGKSAKFGKMCTELPAEIAASKTATPAEKRVSYHSRNTMIMQMQWYKNIQGRKYPYIAVQFLLPIKSLLRLVP